jgi:predicted  nucleic acid-binding Zn-ribbon protein
LRDSRGGEIEKAFNGQPKSLDDIRLRAQFLKDGLLPHRQETQALHEKRLEKLELELKDVVAKRDERLNWQKSVKYEALTELREWAESRRGNGPVAQPAGSEQVPYETLEDALKELEARDAEMPSLVTLEDRVVELEQTIREEHASFERYEQRWEAGNTKLEGNLRLIGEMLNSSRMTSDRLSELEDKHLQALPKFW